MEIFNNHSKKVLELISDGVYLTDPNRVITYWNSTAERITGYSYNETVGISCADNILTHVDDSGRKLCEIDCPLRAAIEERELRATNIYLHHKAGHRIPIKVKTISLRNESGEIVSIAEIFNDVSALRDAQRRINDLSTEAHIDALTQIGNRRLANIEIDSRFEEMKQHGKRFAAALCDIDNFKQINDTYGHDIGDAVLMMVSKTLRKTLRPNDFVGRWGGEEFLILLSGTDDMDNVSKILERSRALIQESYIMKGKEKVSVTTSIGASFVTPKDTSKDLINRIDEYLYHSKNTGKNRISFSIET